MERTEEIIVLLRSSPRWNETAKLVYEYHYIMVELRGQAQPRSGSGWAMRDTAQELKLPLSTVHKYIAAVRHFVYCSPTTCKTLNAFLRKVEDAYKKRESQGT